MSLRVSARAQAAFGGGSSGSGGLPTSSGTSYGYTKLATPAVGTALGAKGTVGTRAFPFQRLGLQVFYPSPPHRSRDLHAHSCPCIGPSRMVDC